MDKHDEQLAKFRQLRKFVVRHRTNDSKVKYQLVLPVIMQGNLHNPKPELQPLPDYSEYMRLIDEAIEREGLSTDDRVVARAFGIAVYRRALANRLMSDVNILASEAIAAVMERLGNQKGRNVKQLTYNYGSTTRERISRRSASERKKKAGEAG